MTEKEQNQTLEIKALEEKLDSLIQLFGSIKEENNSLKTRQEELMREKAKLIEKTTLAKNRVEAMISRLKSMEHGA